MTKLKEPKIKKQEKYIFNPAIYHNTITLAKVMRIEISEKFTIIDFVYHPPKYYGNGHWVRVHKEIFIRPIGSDFKYTLVKAVNIPIAPNRHFFKSANEVLYFTLYFPALPKETSEIDIIESNSSKNIENWFNFYGVSLQNSKAEIVINNN